MSDPVTSQERPLDFQAIPSPSWPTQAGSWAKNRGKGLQSVASARSHPFDPPRVGPHPAGADGRGVPPALGLHGQAAPSPPRQQDPEEVREWLETIYPAIKQRAKQEGAEIPWCDETGVAADEHPRYGYARKGHPAIMEVPDRQIRMNMASAISNEGTVRFMTYQGTMNGELFRVFLNRLLRTSTRKIFLIVDRLSAHEKQTVADWVEAHKDRIEVFPMPPRTPELNPDAYLNNDLKGNVNAAGLPTNNEDLRSQMQHFMRQLYSVPEHVMNYFLHPCVQYAAAT